MEIDRRFVWDYELPKDAAKDKAFQRWYVARVLSRGTLADIRKIGLAAIHGMLPVLVLPPKIRRFWELYFSLQGQGAYNSSSGRFLG